MDTSPDKTYLEEIISQCNQSERIICPSCGPDRKKKYEKTMSVSVTPTETLYMCHHCYISGKVEREAFYTKYIETPEKPAVVIQIPTQLNDSRLNLEEFFIARGTPLNTPEAITLPVMITGRKWYRKINAEVDSIGFVYGSEDEPEAIKWRPIEGKMFTQDGAGKSFYNIESLDKDESTIIIVEGEPDTVAMATIGVKAISVPNGAPEKVSERDNDTKYKYLWESKDLLERADKIILCVDDDSSGEALAEEISRRIGRAKCWRVAYPAGCKDPSDVIRDFGKDAMVKTLESCTPVPLSGVYSAADYAEKVNDLYVNGIGKGMSTGLPSVDNLFTIAEGALYVVTGLPGSGKSEFVDQLMINIATNHGIKSAIASFENQPHAHIAKLAEKLVGKPFYEGVTPRMTRNELEDSLDFINDNFAFLDSKDGDVSTIESIIDRTKQAVMRLGVRLLVIDPYNYIDTGASDKEHKTISDMLTKVVSFAKAYGLTIFFVAHPKGMVPNQDGIFSIPTGMHISGGPTWFAKADVGFTVHRGTKGVEVHCWKVRDKYVGSLGMTYLSYDPPTGRYSEYIERPPLSELYGGNKHNTGAGWD